MGDFPGSPVLKTVLPMQVTWVQSLVEELKFRMSQSTGKIMIVIF